MMSWKETNKNIQLKAGLDKDGKWEWQQNEIREVGQKLLQELNELPSINDEMMRERNGVNKRE